MGFAQFISSLVVFAQALLGAPTRASHKPALHTLIVDWLVALAPSHVVARLPTFPDPVDSDEDDTEAPESGAGFGHGFAGATAGSRRSFNASTRSRVRVLCGQNWRRGEGRWCHCNLLL